MNIEVLKHQLIISCQALPEEPLYSSFIMSKMALAADLAGAAGIRANSISDISAIKKEVNLPIIGIIKKDYEGSNVYITATKKEIDDLACIGPEIIAMDATNQRRPKESLEELVIHCRANYPNILLMADISNFEEAYNAEVLGFDFISTTLFGYTPYTLNKKIEENDFQFVKELVNKLNTPIIAEGNINTPLKVKRVLEIGVFSVVVGGAITRPQLIAKDFVNATLEFKKEVE